MADYARGRQGLLKAGAGLKIIIKSEVKFFGLNGKTQKKRGGVGYTR